MPCPRTYRLPDLGVSVRRARVAKAALADRERDPIDTAEAERTATITARVIAAQGATRRDDGRG